MAAVIEAVPPKHKKPLVRRLHPDRSQTLRRTIQFSFLLLNLWIGVEFLLWVRQFEGAGQQGWSRPPGVEGWLPIAGMMNTKYFLLTGNIPVVHPAAMFLFVTFAGLSLFLRKSFCGWLCPVGTVSELLWKLGRDTFKRNWTLPRWLDIPLRSLKYILMGLFLYAVGSMSAEAIGAFLYSPYGIVADVKMLNFFRYMSTGAAVTVGLFLVASVFVRNFWCRYLCPYGALMGLVSLLSPLRIRRNEARCIDCAKCAKACPSGLAVDKLIQIRSAECIGCMECVAVCPAEDCLGMSVVATKRWVDPRLIAAAIVLVFVGVAGAARWTGHWDSPIPDSMYRRLVPQAHELGHP
ncbi:MAG: 4Fe-4S binding protein [Bryobacterales bacterium]|nr:4Fe-4S binding protein [Bryobacterales bacterium]